jgi:hypothetical protein
MDVVLPKLKIAFFLFCTTTFSLAFDSRNISSTEWICGGVSSRDSVFVTFEDVTPPGPNVVCGTEVFQNVTSAYQSASMPTISYDAADASLLYTVLIVDRDASSAANPTRSPIIHMAIGNVAGEVLFSSDPTTWKRDHPVWIVDYRGRWIATPSESTAQPIHSILPTWITTIDQKGWMIQWPDMEATKVELVERLSALPGWQETDKKHTKDVLSVRLGRALTIKQFTQWSTS